MIRFSCLAESKTPPDLQDVKSEMEVLNQYRQILGSLLQVPAGVHAIQLFLALFCRMEMLIHMNINFFKFE